MKIGKVRLVTIAAIAVVVAAAALAWFFILSPRLATASELQAQADQLQMATLSLRNQYNKALDLKADAPAAAAEAQALFAKMPQTAELPAVLEQITGAATKAGIKANDVSSLTTGIPVPLSATAAAATASSDGTQGAGVQIAKMDIGVTAEGQRDQVLGFLDNLQGLDRALLVTSTIDSAVVATEGGPDNRESMQVGGSMFVLQSKLPDLVAEVKDLIAQAEAQQSGTAQ